MKNQNGGPPVTASKVMTVHEAAAYLRCHYSTLSRLVRRGDLPAFRVGSTWRLLRSTLDEWITRTTARRASRRAKPTGRGRPKR